MDIAAENWMAWSTPEFRFAIAYSPRILDDIRLAVTEAFFSLPHGGVEIGGILFGRHKDGRLEVTGYAPLDCEHAFGPSFTLSANDKKRLAALIAGGPPGHDHVVGWYHSHTRSEICFPAADQEVHREFFPEPWQVALVIKPHTFKPARAGFFFRNADGTFHGESSYCEFVLEPLPAGREVAPSASEDRVPAAVPEAAPRPRAAIDAVPQSYASRSQALPPADGDATLDSPVPEPEAPRQAACDATVETATLRPELPRAVIQPLPESLASRLEAPPHTAIDTTESAAARPELPADASAPPEFPVVPPPAFLSAQPAGRRWAPALALVLLGSALGAGIHQTRALWLPYLTHLFQAREAGALTLGVSALERGGQLQVNWDRKAGAVQTAVAATLVVNDGSGPITIPLSAAQLQTGAFTFVRQTERVDLTLIVEQPEGPPARAAAVFLGKMPQPTAGPASAANSTVQQQRDQLAEEAARLKTDLAREAERTRKLEQSVEAMRVEMQREKLRRTESEPAKSPENQP